MSRDRSTNDEFIKIWRESGLTKQEIADMLCVSLDMVKQWTKSPAAKNFNPVPQIRLDTLKIMLRKKLTNLTASQRRTVLDILKGN